MTEKIDRKQERTFVFLLISCWVCLAGMTCLFWYLTRLGFQQIHPLLPRAIGIVLALFIFSMAIGIGLFLKILILRCDSWYANFIRRLITQYLFPIMIIIGRLVGIPEEGIQQSFISVNNKLVQTKGLSISPEKMMILLPQCLQNNDCTMRITRDIKGCKRCGKCQIANIIPLLEKYNFMCWVATGGTLARKYIAEYHPEAIIAIACERDLSSGIIDCFPIPVYGILNQRPEGPCMNTLVDIEKIQQAIQDFIFKKV